MRQVYQHFGFSNCPESVLIFKQKSDDKTFCTEVYAQQLNKSMNQLHLLHLDNWQETRH